jgi:hypothetical protein
MKTSKRKKPTTTRVSKGRTKASIAIEMTSDSPKVEMKSYEDFDKPENEPQPDAQPFGATLDMPDTTPDTAHDTALDEPANDPEAGMSITKLVLIGVLLIAAVCAAIYLSLPM